jgi:hypothetical protein
LTTESRRELAALDDQAVALAAQQHDVGEARATAAAQVTAVIGRILDRLGDDEGTHKLRNRLATVIALLRRASDT